MQGRTILAATLALTAAPTAASARTWNFDHPGGVPAGWIVKSGAPTVTNGKLTMQIDWRDGWVTRQDGVRTARRVPFGCFTARVRSSSTWGAISSVYALPAASDGDSEKRPELDALEEHHPHVAGAYLHAVDGGNEAANVQWGPGWHLVRLVIRPSGVMDVVRDRRLLLRGQTGVAASGWFAHMNVWGWSENGVSGWGAVPPAHYSATGWMVVDWARSGACG